LVGDTDDNPIWFEKVFDGRSFTQEFRVANDVKIYIALVVLLDCVSYAFTSLNRDRTLVDNYFVRISRLGNFAGRSSDE